MFFGDLGLTGLQELPKQPRPAGHGSFASLPPG